MLVKEQELLRIHWRFKTINEKLITKYYINLVIEGDINIHVLKDSLEVRDIKKILLSHGMHQMVNFPTKYSAGIAIDNVFTIFSYCQKWMATFVRSWWPNLI